MINGNVTFNKERNRWELNNAPPHVCIKLKSMFGHIAKTDPGPYRFDNAADSCIDLLWFMNRYPMQISDSDLKRLKRTETAYKKNISQLEAILLPDYKAEKKSFKQGFEERHYQAQARELWEKVEHLVVGDDLGLGKTTIAIGGFMNTKTLPALVVVQAHLPTQWQNRILQYTDLEVHHIKGRKPYSLPKYDIYIISYTCLAAWTDIIKTGFFKSITFDEIQELRCNGSLKYNAAVVAISSVKYVLGLTATLIYNYGIEAFNIFNAIKPGCLGTYEEFTREWCKGNDKVIADPAAFGTYLRSRFLFIRRTRQEVKRELPPVNKIIHEVDVDDSQMRKVEKLALELSMQVFSGNFMERGQASRELDLLVRKNTGIAKAKEVANYARLFLENNEPVILVGWHRDVYDIWLQELAAYNPVMFTGSEDGNKKDKSKQAFLEGKTNLLIMSLRSGPGTDGLQERCNTMIIGELDWSPGVHNQIIARLDRDGQKNIVTAVFIVCNFGSDPTMIDVLGLKSSQAKLINDPLSTGNEKQHSDLERVKKLAMNYLQKHGINPEQFKTPEPNYSTDN